MVHYIEQIIVKNLFLEIVLNVNMVIIIIERKINVNQNPLIIHFVKNLLIIKIVKYVIIIIILMKKEYAYQLIIVLSR